MSLVRELKFTVPGLFLGLVVGYLFSAISNLINDDISNSKRVFRERSKSLPTESRTTLVLDDSVRTEERPRILCMVFTTPENHATRAQKIKMTWGKRCTFLLFMSNVQDDALPSVALAVPSDKKHLWGKTREALRYAWDNYNDKVDWFFKVEDDTYTIVENLRSFLSQHDTSEPIWFGYNRTRIGEAKVATGFHEGAGYALSKEATRRFAEIGYFNNLLCKHHQVGEQRIEMGLCMKNLNVTAVASHDSEGKERFFPGVPEDHSAQHSIKGPSLKSLGCCSDVAITFHYFEPDQIFLMEYLVYHFEPYNISGAFF